MASQLRRDVFLDRLPMAVAGMVYVRTTKRASATKCCK